MDIKNLLAVTTTLLFLSSQCGADVTKNYEPVAKEVLQHCRPVEGQQNDLSLNPINGLRDIINWQIHSKNNDTAIYLQQLKLKLAFDEPTFQAIKTTVDSSNHGDETRILAQVRNTRQFIDQCLAKYKFIQALDKIRFKYGVAPVNSDQEKEILATLQLEIDKVKTRGENKHVVREINMNDLSSIGKAVDDAAMIFNTEGILKFGLQGFCDLFGDHQGIRRGETVVVSALQHKWKSGVLLTAAPQLAYFNKPTFLRLPPPEEGKEDKRKALMLHICLENELVGDMMQIYKYIREQLERTPINITGLTAEEKEFAANYVKNFFDSTGFEFKMVQYAAGELDYAGVFDLIEGYEEEGYEIHFVSLDYMGKMSTRGCVEGPHGKNIQDLYQRLQGFFLRKRIAFLTAHQMSTEAKSLVRDGEETLVKAVCELGYYAGCRTVDNEVDMEIYQHLVEIGKKKYITWQRGKHRKPGEITPSEMKFCVYEMQLIATIPWDVGDEPRYSRRLPGYGNSDINVDLF